MKIELDAMLQKTLIRVCLAAMHFCFCAAQNIPQGQFVTVPTQPINIDSKTTKIYNTTLTNLMLNNTTDFSETIFKESVDTFYADVTLTNLSGFLSSEVQSPKNTSEAMWQISYNITYNYSELNNSAGGLDDNIEGTIGDATFVRTGLESNEMFTSTFVMSNSPDNFNFTGVNHLCPGESCDPGLYVKCTENISGVSITCVSVCLDGTPSCLNGGYCHHSDPNTKPTCSCPSSADSWYVGDRCETLFQLWMMVLFFVVVFIILAILIPLTTYFCVRKIDGRITKDKEKKERKKLLAAEKNNAYNNKAYYPEKEKETDATTKNIDSSTPAAPVSVPSPAPRNRYISSPNRTLQRQKSTSSGDSFDATTTPASTRHHSTSHPASTRHDSTSDADSVEIISASHLDISPVGKQESQVQVTPPVVNTSADFENIHEHSREPETTSDESSLSDSDDTRNDAVGQPPYNEPPVYSSVNEKPIKYEEPLISTV